MAIKVKSIDDVAKKWAEVTPLRAAYYEEAAKVAGDDWERGSVAAAAAFKAGVTSPNIDKMFIGGIKRAGAEKYNRKVAGPGKDRFGPGVLAGEPDYRSGEAPMLDTIRGITLPARQTRGSLANYERVKAIGVELNKKRLALRAAGA